MNYWLNEIKKEEEQKTINVIWDTPPEIKITINLPNLPNSPAIKVPDVNIPTGDIISPEVIFYSTESFWPTEL